MMALERFGMRCPICGDAFYLGKHMCAGIYNNDSGCDRLDLLYDWMWEHLNRCREATDFGNALITLFEVVAEGHPLLDFSPDKHWNRHKKGDFTL